MPNAQGMNARRSKTQSLRDQYPDGKSAGLDFNDANDFSDDDDV